MLWSWSGSEVLHSHHSRFDDQNLRQFEITGTVYVQGSGNPETTIYKAFLEYTECNLGCPYTLQAIIGLGTTTSGGLSNFNIAYAGLPQWAVFPYYIWHLRVNECNLNGCNEREGLRVELGDVRAEPPNVGTGTGR